MKTMYRAIAICALVAAATTSARAGSVPDEVTFTARLLNQGAPFAGSVTLKVDLFDKASEGTSLWTETLNATASDGLVAVRLGQQMSLGKAVELGARYLEVTVNGTVLSPRLAIGSAPYALRAEHANNAAAVGGVPADQLQRRIKGSCPSGESVRAIGEDGAVSCAGLSVATERIEAQAAGTVDVTTAAPRALCALTTVQSWADYGLCRLSPQTDGRWTLRATNAYCVASCF